jgi:hypothetical protein
VALWTSAAEAHGLFCTCEHEPGSTCPMHHKSTKSPAHCSMRSATGSAAAILTNLVGLTGLVSESTSSPVTPVTTQNILATVPDLIGRRPIPPDPPPPRA